MPYNESQKKATMKYLKAHTDDVRLRVPKGCKDKWKKYAESQGMSLTSFVSGEINRIIDEEERAL